MLKNNLRLHWLLIQRELTSSASFQCLFLIVFCLSYDLLYLLLSFFFPTCNFVCKILTNSSCFEMCYMSTFDLFFSVRPQCQQPSSLRFIVMLCHTDSAHTVTAVMLNFLICCSALFGHTQNDLICCQLSSKFIEIKNIAIHSVRTDVSLYVCHKMG